MSILYLTAFSADGKECLMVDLSSISQALSAAAAALKIYEFFSNWNFITSMEVLKKLYGVDKFNLPPYILVARL